MPQNSTTADHRSVDAEADVAVAAALGHGTAEAGAVATGHGGLHGQLAGNPAGPAERRHRVEHLRWAAGVDGGALGIVAREHDAQQVGDVAVVTGVAVGAGPGALAAAAAGGAG